MAWLQRGKYDAIQDFLLSPALRALPANPQLTPPAPLRCAGGYTLDARSAGSDLFSIECRNSRARRSRAAGPFSLCVPACGVPELLLNHLCAAEQIRGSRSESLSREVSMSTVSRRNFLRVTGSATAASLLGAAASRNVFGANDRVRVAIVGVRGRGNDH